MVDDGVSDKNTGYCNEEEHNTYAAANLAAHQTTFEISVILINFGKNIKNLKKNVCAGKLKLFMFGFVINCDVLEPPISTSKLLLLNFASTRFFRLNYSGATFP